MSLTSKTILKILKIYVYDIWVWSTFTHSSNWSNESNFGMMTSLDFEHNTHRFPYRSPWEYENNSWYRLE